MHCAPFICIIPTYSMRLFFVYRIASADGGNRSLKEERCLRTLKGFKRLLRWVDIVVFDDAVRLCCADVAAGVRSTASLLWSSTNKPSNQPLEYHRHAYDIVAVKLTVQNFDIGIMWTFHVQTSFERTYRYICATDVCSRTMMIITVV